MYIQIEKKNNEIGLITNNSFRESVENRMNYFMLNMTTPISNTAQTKVTHTHCHTFDICTIKSLSSILNIIQAGRVFISSKTSLYYKFIRLWGIQHIFSKNNKTVFKNTW